MADHQRSKNPRSLLKLIKIVLAILVAIFSLNLCGRSEETSNLHPLFEFGFDHATEIVIDGVVEIFLSKRSDCAIF
jgi:hypothetical protein